MRQHNGSRRNGPHLAKPIRPAIDHDACVLVLDQQCTMASVLARVRLNPAARAEEREFKRVVFCCHQSVKQSYKVAEAYSTIVKLGSRM